LPAGRGGGAPLGFRKRKNPIEMGEQEKKKSTAGQHIKGGGKEILTRKREERVSQKGPNLQGGQIGLLQ